MPASFATPTLTNKPQTQQQNLLNCRTIIVMVWLNPLWLPNVKVWNMSLAWCSSLAFIDYKNQSWLFLYMLCYVMLWYLLGYMISYMENFEAILCHSLKFHGKSFCLFLYILWLNFKGTSMQTKKINIFETYLVTWYLKVLESIF